MNKKKDKGGRKFRNKNTRSHNFRGAVGFSMPKVSTQVYFVLGTSQGSARRLRLPPGPLGLPILGHLHLLGSTPHKSLADLSKHYGPLIYLRYGSIPVVVASSPAIAKLILQKHDQTFAWRAQPTVFKLMRQLFATDLFATKRLQAFGPMIAEEVRAMLSNHCRLGPSQACACACYHPLC
ncbi:hypothetical protein L7F22_038020 [Adiantum nelumboides]|nr:hypothetical protein [Adiantum nelumboides]